MQEFIEDGHDRRISIASLDERPGLPGGAEDTKLPEHWFSWHKLWLYTGPGFLMSIAYLVRRHVQWHSDDGGHVSVASC